MTLQCNDSFDYSLESIRIMNNSHLVCNKVLMTNDEVCGNDKGDKGDDARTWITSIAIGQRGLVKTASGICTPRTNRRGKLVYDVEFLHDNNTGQHKTTNETTCYSTYWKKGWRSLEEQIRRI